MGKINKYLQEFYCKLRGKRYFGTAMGARSSY